MIQYFMRKDVLLSVDPEVREPLLCGVEDLRQIAETAFLIEYLIRFRKLLSVVPGGAVCFEILAEPFDLVQKPLARPLSIF